MEVAREEFFYTNSVHKYEINLFWESGKAYLREKVISYAASYKKHALTSYREDSLHL